MWRRASCCSVRLLDRCHAISRLEQRLRIPTSLTLPLLAALAALPARAPAPVTISVQLGTRLGPEIPIFAYTPERLGD
jgi:hypothetical protein